jgi:hypothetical protein
VILKVAIWHFDFRQAIGGACGSGRHGGVRVLRGVSADWQTHGVSWTRHRQDNARYVDGRQKRTVFDLLAALEYNNERWSQRKIGKGDLGEWIGAFNGTHIGLIKLLSDVVLRQRRD